LVSDDAVRGGGGREHGNPIANVNGRELNLRFPDSSASFPCQIFLPIARAPARPLFPACPSGRQTL